MLTPIRRQLCRLRHVAGVTRMGGGRACRGRRVPRAVPAVHRTGVQHARVAEDDGEPEREQRVQEAGERAHWALHKIQRFSERATGKQNARKRTVSDGWSAES